MCQFLFTVIISHLLANLGHIYQVCSSFIASTLVSALLPFNCLIPPPVSFQPLSSSSCPKRGDTAINLRVANELHLTIKCTENGTFHLQEDQWQWQTPFSQRLVSGMMFRRQSNQSQHTDAEINQRRQRKEEEKDLKLFSLYCIYSLYLNRPILDSKDILYFFFISYSVSPSNPWSTREGSWEARGGEWVITIRGVKCSIIAIPICDPTSS